MNLYLLHESPFMNLLLDLLHGHLYFLVTLSFRTIQDYRVENVKK